jgi:GT2 family glycosyltransferase
MRPKTLVLMPVYEASEFLETPYIDQTVSEPISVLESLHRLNPPPDKFIFLENNSLDDTLRKLADFKNRKEIIRLWFREDAMDYIERNWHAGEQAISSRYDLIGICRQLLLQRARQLDPDYAIFLDSDIVVLSKDLIERFGRFQKTDIVGAPYERDFPQGRLLSALWPNLYPTPEQPFQLLPRNRISSSEPTEALAVGGGCMRLSRKIIHEKTLNFYPVQRPWLGVGALAEDFGYCLHARALGYGICLDPTIRLAHWSPTREQLRGNAWTSNEYGELMHFTYAA